MQKEDREQFRVFLLSMIFRFFRAGHKAIWNRLCLTLSMFTLHRVCCQFSCFNSVQISEDDVNLRNVSLMSFFTNGIPNTDLESVQEPILRWLTGIAEQTSCNDLNNNAQYCFTTHYLIY
jgi:hypothetical protein